MNPSSVLLRSLMALLPGIAVMATGTGIMLGEYKEIKIKVEQVKEQLEAHYREIERIAAEI